MRSDLIIAGLVHRWLTENAPQIAAQWDIQFDDNIVGFVDKVKAMFPEVDGLGTAQHALAKEVIEQWGLTNVAILGGGLPTPLSPRPDQILYHTDMNPDVLRDAEALGYRTRLADVRNPEAFDNMPGATTAIGVGLFHFLDDDQVRVAFNNLSRAGFQTVVFNNVNPVIDEELLDNWIKLGYKFFLRTADEVQRVLPDDWHVERVHSNNEIVKQFDVIGPKLANLPNFYDVFYVVRK